MIRDKALVTIVALGISATSVAGAGGAGPSAPLKLQPPPVISKMIERGKDVAVVDSFPVDGTALTAWVLAAKGETRIYYVTPDQQHVIYGLLFDKNLANVTAQQIRAYPVAPLPVQAVREQSHGKAGAVVAGLPVEHGEAITEALAIARRATPVLVEGSGKDVFIVFDAGCKFCHQLWHETRLRLARSRLHWIPVSKATRVGGPLAQSIMDSANRYEAMTKAASGQLAPSPVVRSEVLTILSQNAKILDAAGKKHVPFILFEERGQPAAYLGVPKPHHMDRIFGNATGANKR